MTHLLALALLGQEAMTGHTREVNCVAVADYTGAVASGSADKTVRLWTGTASTVVEGHDGDVLSISFSQDGTRFATGEMYKKVRVFETATGKLVSTTEGFDGRVSGVAFADNINVFAASHDNTLRKINCFTGKILETARHNWEVRGVAACPHYVASVDGNGELHTWSLTKLERIATASHPGVRCIAMTPGGGLVATGGGDGPIQIWPSQAGKLGEPREGPALDALALAFTWDGKRLAVGTFDGIVAVVDVATGSVTAQHSKHERPVTGVAWAEGGKTVYSSSMDMTVRAWKP